MNIYQTVTNVFGEEVTVDYGNKKIYSYSNKDGVITYNARIIENGEPTEFFTDFKETGTVDDIEQRLSTWNNVVKIAYAISVNYEASINDPNKEIWRSLVELIKQHPSYCFDEYGDFLKNFAINPEDITKIKEA